MELKKVNFNLRFLPCMCFAANSPEVGTAGIVAMVVRGAVGVIQPLVGQDLNSTVFSERYGFYIYIYLSLWFQFYYVFFEYGIPRGQIWSNIYVYIYIYICDIWIWHASCLKSSGLSWHDHPAVWSWSWERHRYCSHGSSADQVWASGLWWPRILVGRQIIMSGSRFHFVLMFLGDVIWGATLFPSQNRVDSATFIS